MPTVLVAEDDQQTREVLRLLLTDEGYTVNVANGGVTAVEMLREMPGHVVVLFDYVMSEGNGLYLLNAVADDVELKRRHAYICMTAHPRELLPDEFQSLVDRLGVPFIDKPFDIGKLLQAVNDSSQWLMKATTEERGDTPQVDCHVEQ